MFSVIECSIDDQSKWNDFVVKNHGTYCHLFEWSGVFHDSYQLKTLYLAISDKDKSRWVGVLPLAIIPGLFSGNVVSVPYCNYGGMLFADDVDRYKVSTAAISYLRDMGINQIEMRSLGLPDAAATSSEVTMLLDLPSSSEVLWKQVGDKVRNQVRKAERAGLVAKWGRDQLDELYDIYAENMGRLGTPVHARGFFESILNAFRDESEILTVRLEDKPVAAMLVLKFGSIWIDPIASSKAEFRHLNPNMLLYWEALRQSILSGATRFDFGRSQRDSGTYKFKKQWGAKEIPLDYHTYKDGQLKKEASTNLYRGGSAAMFAKLWSNLPRLIQRVAGPKVRRYIP